MTAYLIFEWTMIVLLLGLSFRLLWQRVIQPMLQRPKAACGSGCTGCASTKS